MGVLEVEGAEDFDEEALVEVEAVESGKFLEFLIVSFLSNEYLRNSVFYS